MNKKDRLLAIEKAKKMIAEGTEIGLCRAFKWACFEELGRTMGVKDVLVEFEMLKYVPEKYKNDYDRYWWPMGDSVSRLAVLDQMIVDLKKES